MKTIFQDLKRLDTHQFAKVTKTTFCTIDDRHPVALHSWLKIPKGTTVGLIDNVPEKFDSNLLCLRVRAYAPHGNAYMMVTLPYDRIKLIKEK